MEHAAARFARVEDVVYALEFELDGEADAYTGHVRTDFELRDAHSDLNVDFAGGTGAERTG